MNALTNYNFNYNAVFTGVSSFAILTIGLIIFLQNTKSAINRFFLLSCLSIFVWLSGFSMVYLSKEGAVALTWFKYYSHLGVVSIVPNVYFFNRAVTRGLRNLSPWFIVGYFLSLLFYGLGFGHNFIVGTIRYPWGWYPHYSPLSYCFLSLFLSLMVLSVSELWRALGKSESKTENKKIKILLIATLIGYTGILDFLPALGIALYPFGYLTVFIWISLVGYVVLRYKLMMITPAIAAEQIISLIPDFLILADPGGKIIQVNRAVKETLGYGQNELTRREAKIVFAEKTAADSLVSDLLKRGAIRNFETAYQSKDGKKIPVIFSASIVRNASGDIQGFVFTALDITELKRSEEKFQEAQAQLIQSSKMASVGLLAGGVAHEINNPLTGVLNNVQLIKMMTEAKKDFSMNDFKELLGVIENSAIRCKKITQSLLDFSSASKEIFQLLSFNGIIDKVVVLIEQEFKLQNIAIQKELEPELPAVSGDSQLLQHAIFDIISNARWAIQQKSQKEGGTITIKTQYEPEGKNIRIFISDTGIGIPKENQDKIFEPFFTTKAVGESTGLGLAIVYNIIKAHYGNIKVESEINQGTTFTISLPVTFA
jgi:PAS domain S-box-containing protein